VAFVAGMSVGVFSNWGEVLRFAVHGPRYDPDQRAVERYRQGYGVYRELYERLRTLFPLMRGLDAPLP
jgi:xylulokinase